MEGGSKEQMKETRYAIRFNREKLSAVEVSKEEFERIGKEAKENYKNVKTSEMDESSTTHYKFTRYAHKQDLYARITLIERTEDK